MKARLPEGYNMKQGDMMRKVQKMQEDVAAAQKEVEETVFSAKSGGGMVSVEMNGKKELLSVRLEKEAVDPDDVEMLEDMIVAAVNEAVKQIDSTLEEKMNAATGGLNLNFPML